MASSAPGRERWALEPDTLLESEAGDVAGAGILGLPTPAPTHAARGDATPPVDEPRRASRHLALEVAAVVALLSVMAIIRLVHLRADPPADLDWSGGVFFDEGMLAHGARNRVLFGRPDIDDWNDFFISPLLAYVKWGVFAVLGVGLAQVRLIPVVFGLGTLVLTYLAVRRDHGPRVALLALSLLGFSYVFVMFNRLGLTETSALFFMSLGGFLWGEGFARLPRAGLFPSAFAASGSTVRLPATSAVYFALAGASVFTSYVWKSYPSFLVVPFVAIAAAARPTPSQPLRVARGSAWRAALATAIGLTAVALPWYALFVRPHHAEIARAMRFYQTQSLPRDLGQALRNVRDLSFFRVFQRDPVLLYASFGYLGFILYQFFNDRAHLAPQEFFAATWYGAQFGFDALLNYTPVRYHVPLLPPMCALTACAIARGANLRSLPVHRLRAVSVPFLWLWMVLLLAHLPLGPQLGARARLLGAGTIAVAALSVAFLVGKRLDGREWRFPGFISMALFAVLPLGYTFPVQARDYLRWYRAPGHAVRDASRKLQQTLDHAWIAGLAAPELCLETHHHPLHVYPGFFNDRELFDRYPVTHLLLDNRQREQNFYYTNYGDRVQDAVLLDSFSIGRTNLFLLSLVEPRIERFEVEHDLAPDRFGGRVTVRTPPNGQPREARIGWALVPQAELGSPPAPTIAPDPIDALELTPGEVREAEIAGPAPPGRYSVVAYLLPAHRAVLQGRFFDHQTGREVADPLAVDGSAWESGISRNRKSYLAYGPYLRFGPGRIRVSFRLRAGAPAASGDLANLEIARGLGHGVLRSLPVTAADLPADGSYRDFELEYYHDADEVLEFRVLSFCRAELWLDQVAIEYAQGAWSEEPVEIAGSPAPAGTG